MNVRAQRALPSLSTVILSWVGFLLLLLTPLKFGIAGDRKAPRSPLKSMSLARVLGTYDLQDFGSHVVKYGRGTSEGGVVAVFAQIDANRLITCITVMSLADGSILWRRGEPNRKNFRTSGEIPVQVYDWNDDQIDDVIFWQDNQILVASGIDGSIIASIDWEQPYSLYIYQTNQFGGHAGLVAHGREATTLFGPDLSVTWSHSNGFSHFPMQMDVDQDGEPELLAGYLLLSSHGDVVWDRTDLGVHNDSADFEDINCDGINEIAIAPSGKAAILSPTGDILWRGVEHHNQHITMGSFLPGRCDKQIATVDRDKEDLGIVRLYDNTGKILWQRSGFGNRAIMSRIDGWIPGIPESLVIIFRASASPPTILDGAGRVVAQLPFPPALKKKGKQETYSLHFVQHFDYDGDGQEELFVSNERALWIYSNGVLGASTEGTKAAQTLPNPRIFNSTFYFGMQ